MKKLIIFFLSMILIVSTVLAADTTYTHIYDVYVTFDKNEYHATGSAPGGGNATHTVGDAIYVGYYGPAGTGNCPSTATNGCFWRTFVNIKADTINTPYLTGPIGIYFNTLSTCPAAMSLSIHQHDEPTYGDWWGSRGGGSCTPNVTGQTCDAYSGTTNDGGIAWGGYNAYGVPVLSPPNQSFACTGWNGRFNITDYHNTDSNKNFGFLISQQSEGTNLGTWIASFPQLEMDYTNDIPTVDSCNLQSQPKYRGETGTLRLTFTDTTPASAATSTIEWKNDGSYTSASFSTSGSGYREHTFTIPSDYVGDYDLRCTIDDLYNQTQSEFNNIFSISNRLPSLTVTNIATSGTDPEHNSNPDSTEDLLIKGSCTDADTPDQTGVMNITYNVYKDSVLQSGFSGIQLVNSGTNYTLTTVPSANTSVGENWYVQMDCDDPFNTDSLTSSNSTILSGNPTANVTVQPLLPLYTDNLFCNVTNIADPDNDTVSIGGFDWYKDTVPQGINSSTLGFGNTSFAEQWYCHVVLDDGFNQINDTSDNTVTIDTNDASFVFNSPTNGSTVTHQSLVLLDVEPTDSDGLNTCWWNLNGGSNNTITCNETTRFDTTPGNHSITYYSNDTYGDLNFETIYFTTLTDASNPSVTITSPVNGSTVDKQETTDTFTVSAVISDNGELNTCWYINYNASGFPGNSTVFTCSDGTNNFDLTVDFFGTHQLDIFANDTEGNSDNDSIIWSISQSEDGGGGGGGGPVEEKEVPVPFFVREKTVDVTCGFDADQDGLLCDANEDWISCPDDCEVPSLDAMLCLGGGACVWREAWFLKMLFLMLILTTIYLIYTDFQLLPRKRRLFK